MSFVADLPPKKNKGGIPCAFALQRATRGVPQNKGITPKGFPQSWHRFFSAQVQRDRRALDIGSDRGAGLKNGAGFGGCGYVFFQGPFGRHHLGWELCPTVLEGVH